MVAAFGSGCQYIPLSRCPRSESRCSRHPPIDAAPIAEVPMGSAADAPHGSRPEQVYSRLRDLIVQGLARAGQPNRRNRNRQPARRQSHAGTRSAAAPPAGRIRHRIAGRAAVAADRRAAHARRCLRAAEHRRRARGNGRARRRAASPVPSAEPHSRSERAQRRVPPRRQGAADRPRRVVRRRRAVPSPHRRGERRPAPARAYTTP